MGQTSIRDPNDLEAGHLQFGVSLPILLERLEAGVMRSAVELHHHSLAWPGGIDAVAGDDDVGLRRLEPAVEAEVVEAVLERGLRVWRVAVELGKSDPESFGAPPSPAPSEQFLECPQVEAPQPL